MLKDGMKSIESNTAKDMLERWYWKYSIKVMLGKMVLKVLKVLTAKVEVDGS